MLYQSEVSAGLGLIYKINSNRLSKTQIQPLPYIRTLLGAISYFLGHILAYFSINSKD